jgi:phosphoserine aminotransferase
MNTIYFTPGPSHLYETYQQHLMQAMNLQLGSINHRSNAFRSIYQHTDEQLRILMDIPSSHAIFFASSATEIWEKIILNCVENDSFHLTNGAFSNKFYEFAKMLKKSPSQYNVNDGLGFDINDIHIPEQVELICTTQNETSTGVQLPIEDLHQLKLKYQNKLICTDLVSVAPYSQINYSLIDCSFFSVQKAFGMPPGLGVWIVNQACLKKAEELKNKHYNIGAHNTLESYFKNYKTFETPSTPNVIAIYILGKIAEDMNRKGLKTIREEIDIKADMIYNFSVSKEGYTPLVEETKHRSKTVAVINTIEPYVDIINSLKPFNMTIGSGYGKLKANQIRIANFPATSIADMEDLLAHL